SQTIAVCLTLPLPPLSAVQLLKSSELGRHSLLYVKEIGHGWFGKVLLGEVNAGLSTTQVVVKELKASASVQDQMHFLEEAQPYRALQNPALLQCLAQCSEVTPYLLVMEFCPLVRETSPNFIHGPVHLHKHNFIHSDLALRNCLLTSERTVKIGDYGLSHSRYKDDYFVTPDQIWVPLRWIAPELIDEVHGNLLVVDQTKDSNVWSLGVTIWELFELGNQPYRHYTDRQVLTYAVKEQQLKLTRPRLKVPLAERWYEVMQFCWLQPEQRPNSEEVHLLLTYLCAKGASGVQEDFEQRWNSLRPNLTGSSTHSHTAPAPPPLTQTTVPAPARPSIPGDVELEPASTPQLLPLLEHFSHDSFHSDSGDDILTVTETSYGGLNFEYKWEQARAEQPYCSSSTSGPLGQGNPHYQDVYYPVGNTSTSGSCKGDGGGGGLVLGVSPSYYESDHSGSGSGSGVGVVPVLSAHSPSVGSEYYIRIEEPVECNINLDDSVVDYSPGLEAEDGSLSSGSRTPQPQSQSQSQPSAYWSAAAGDSSGGKHSTHDSDNSPALSLTMEPLLRQTASTASPVELGRSHQYFSPNQRQAFYCEQSPIRETCCQSPEDTPIMSQLNLHHPMGRLETPLGVGSSHSQCLSSPSLGHCDPYLEASQGFSTTARRTVSEGYYDMMGPLRKTLPMAKHISIDVETGDGGLLVGAGGEEKREATNWTSNHSANNNSMTFDLRQTGQSQDSYLDLHYTNTTTHSSTVTGSCNSSNMCQQHSSRAFSYMEATGRESAVCSSSSRPNEGSSATTYSHLCHGARDKPVCLSDHSTLDHLRGVAVDSLSSSSVAVKCVNLKGGVKDGVPTTKTTTTVSVEGHSKNPSLITGERKFSLPKMIPGPGCIQSPSTYMELDTRTGLSTKAVLTEKQGGNVWETPSYVKDRGPVEVMSGGVGERRLGMGLAHPEGVLLEPVGSLFEASRGLDSGLEMAGHSSISLVDISNCSYDDEDDDITDITSGILADYSLDYADEVGDDLSPAHHPDGRSLQNPVGTPDSVDTLDMLSLSLSVTTASPCEAFSLDDSLDSGYDTENNESPEFILKEGGGNGEFLLDCEGNQQQHPVLGGSHLARGGVSLGPRSDQMVLQQVDLGDGVGVTLCTSSSSGCTELQLKGLSDKNPFVDSAYFSDYDAENERSPQDEGSNFFSSPGDKKDFVGHTASKQRIRSARRDELQPQTGREDGYHGGCLAKESAPDDAVGLESEHSGEEPASGCSSTMVSEGSSTVQEASARHPDQENHHRASEDDYSPIQSLGSDSTIDYREERGGERRGGGEGWLQQTPERSCWPTHLISIAPLLLPLTPGAVSGGGEASSSNRGEESDDSESEEELRSYNLQEELSEEDSEGEVMGVPVVVSDSSGSRNLRSLLKMPKLLTQSFCDELDRKKKAVSFFDDVTVFLFDQESPTGELADFTFPPGAESSGQASGGENPQPDLQPHPTMGHHHHHPTMGHHLHPPGRAPHASEDSDGNMSEEGGGFEWEDDIPLMTSPLSSPSTAEPPVSDPIPVPAAKPPEDKPPEDNLPRASR
ncbi:LOW QUALITY PROTEIN: serine/threonine-protein kinase LMTK1, partial [Oncorhynchus tshawytscha]|uniref:LOW QUALITY PROTEIN: serine/threonine-protein kinase LMTK1 n=1 Tax=Oncorhynchus tshawytscha TaxID=74940 RepID=UPI001C3D51CB